MNHEKKIISAAIQSRDAFDAVDKHLADGDFTEQGMLVWRAVDEYYQRDGDAGHCDADILARLVARKVTSDKHREQFGGLVRELASWEISPQNIIHDYIQVKKEAAGDRLASALLGGKATGEQVEEYQKWCEAETLEDADDRREVYAGMPLAEILESYDTDNLIGVWPKSLNERLDGGLLRGHHMVVFARPEMGKAAFVINACAGFLAQGLTVLYVGNEEPLQDTGLRMISRLSGRTKYDVLQDPQRCYDKAVEEGYERFVMAKLTPGTPREISKLCEEFKPDVLVLDQLRNIWMKEDNYTQKLEKVATAARQIGKQHNCVVISVTQAGDSASGRAVLEMGDIDSSNTGIPAQADVMVGIGATSEDEAIGRRVLSLPKNKRSGKHDSFPVKADFALGRIIGIE